MYSQLWYDDDNSVNVHTSVIIIIIVICCILKRLFVTVEHICIYIMLDCRVKAVYTTVCTILCLRLLYGWRVCFTFCWLFLVICEL